MKTVCPDWQAIKEIVGIVCVAPVFIVLIWRV